MRHIPTDLKRLARVRWTLLSILLLAAAAALVSRIVVAHSVANLVAAYPFIEGAGVTANDASGSSNTGALLNGAGWATGRYGTGLSLDGTNDHVSVPDSPYLDIGSTGTIEAWVKLDTGGRWHSVLAKGNANSDPAHNYAIEINTTQRVICSIGNGTSSISMTSTSALGTGQFYHLACTWNGSQFNMYIDGVLNRTVNQTLTPLGNTAPLFIGQYGGNVDRLDGIVDEVRIYNIALSQIDVQEDRAAPIQTAPDTTPPSASMVSPVAGSSVSGNIALVASAADDRVVAGVTFFLDGAPLGVEDTIEPYSITWDTTGTTNAPHNLSAVARDATGNTGTSAAISVTVTNPPRLVITQPANGASFQDSTVQIAYAVAGDATGFAVDHVHFQVDGGPEIMDLPPLDGSYTLAGVTAGAHSLSGFLVRSNHTKINGTDAVPVGFVIVVPDSVPPGVNVTSPSNGASVAGTVTLAANATDNVAVAGVRFYVDGSPIGAEDVSPPYSMPWNAVGSGTRVITAVARDVSNNVTTSSPVVVTVTNPNDPALVGQWSAVMNWPIVAVHATLLPTGEILMWDAWELPDAEAKVWNPGTGLFINVPVDAGVFCSAHALLPDGRALVIGGHAGGEIGIRDAFTFDPNTRSWTTVADMQVSRWYPSATRLADGRVVAFSGQITPGVWADVPEIYNPLTNQWTLMSGVNSANMHDSEYPLSFPLPDGRIYVISAVLGQTHALTFAPNGWTNLGAAPFLNGSAAMFRPGKVLMTGGGPYGSSSASRTQASVVDLTQPSPAWRTLAPMVHGRALHNLVVLADGNVLAVGGATTVNQTATVGVLPAELWNAASETWSTMAAMRDPRMYHSTGLLMPDGRVLVAGGGRLGGIPSYTTAEFYSPPYLFRGARPTLTSFPTGAVLGETITLESPDAASVSRVALVPLGSVTHTLNMHQTYVELPFTILGNDIRATLPSSPNIVSPGHYLVFVLNGNGVPAVAPFLRVYANPGDVDSIAPTVTMTAPPQGATVSGTLSVTANASDNVGVMGVQFLLDDQPLGAEDPSAPYAVSWNTIASLNGPHRLTARARDAGGNVTLAAQVNVTVSNAGGDSGILGYSAVGASVDSADANYTTGWRFVMPTQSATAVSLSVYVAGPVSAAPNNQFQVALYGDLSGLPGTLIVASTSRTLVANAWNTVPLAAPLLPNTAYWLAYNTNASSSTANNVRLDPGTSGQMRWRSQPFGTWPATFGSPQGTASSKASIYVSYTSGSATPRLSFTQPAEGATVAGSTVAVTYTVTGDTPGSGVDHVHYRVDGGAELMDPPPLDGSFSLPNLAPGPHTLTGYLVRADHSTIVGSDATPLHFTVPAAPRLVFTQPAEGATVPGSTVAVAYTVTGDTPGSGVDHVHYRVDGGAEIMDPPPLDGSFSLPNLAPGPHTLTGYLVRADHSTIVGSDAIPLHFTVPGSAPRLVFTQPAEGATVPGSTVSVLYAVTGDAPGSGVDHVHYRVDGGAEIMDPPPLDGSFSLPNLAAGPHTLTGYLVRADHSTIVGSDATPLHFTVPDTTAPTVAMTAPPQGATVSGTASVTANASDNVGVMGVQFLLDDQPLGAEDTGTPYAVSWSTSGSTNGPHRLAARARDAAGNVTTAAQVNVTVSNTGGTTATLGYSTVGATVDSNDRNYMNAWRFVMPNQSGTASSLSVYIASPVSAAPSNQFQVALYRDQSGVPGTLIVASTSRAIVANAWNTVPLVASLTPNTAYWLAYNTNASSSTANNVRLDPGTSNQMRWRSQTFGTWPTTFGSPQGADAAKASIYLTYTTP